MMPAGHNAHVPVAPFSVLAARTDPPLDQLALAIAAQFREVDTDPALQRLDELGEEVAASEPMSDLVVDWLGRIDTDGIASALKEAIRG